MGTKRGERIADWGTSQATAQESTKKDCPQPENSEVSLPVAESSKTKRIPLPNRLISVFLLDLTAYEEALLAPDRTPFSLAMAMASVEGIMVAEDTEHRNITTQMVQRRRFGMELFLELGEALSEMRRQERRERRRQEREKERLSVSEGKRRQTGEGGHRR